MVPLNLTYLHCLQHSFLNISSIYISMFLYITYEGEAHQNDHVQSVKEECNIKSMS